MRNIDYIALDASQNYDMLPNGFLSLTALLTRTGVFTYQQVDPETGKVSVIRQLRLAEEVFAEETLASMSGLPLTNNHPSELISPENASDYVVGMASENPKRVKAPVQGDNEEYVQQKLTFMDSGVIDLVLSGDKKELSLGYTCKLEPKSGLYNGVQYDCIQREIRVNHCSLVRKARGGENCKVLLDGVEKVINLDGISISEDNNETKECKLKVFTHGGKEYKVADDVYALLESLHGDLEKSTANLDSKDAEISKLTGQCEELAAKIEVQKDSDDDAEIFAAAVRARVALESKAVDVLGKDVNLDGLSDREIKEKVITKLRPNVNLDGKNDDYIEGRFEMAVEDLESTENADSQEKLAAGVINNDGANDAWTMAEKARKAAWDKTVNLWKGDK